MMRALLLAAGLGTRLKPLTDDWPKCLMPISGRPLLEYWLDTLHRNGINDVLVNTHFHAEKVATFLGRARFSSWVKSTYEAELLGTAGTLRANAEYFRGHTTLLVHADNWCQCDFAAFIHHHRQHRRASCAITMMTFETDTPTSCGIVETTPDGIVTAFHEKVANPPGNRANAAVYILEPEVLEWLEAHPAVSDFSTEVLPEFIGRICTWHNNGIHRDIGTYPTLTASQLDIAPMIQWQQPDEWQTNFEASPVFRAVTKLSSQDKFQ